MCISPVAFVKHYLQITLARFPGAPADRDNPAGWRDVGKQGLKQECLDYTKEVWTDMRPLSLRRQMDAAQST
ncbi:MAG: MbtH family NRPS accessory protein [Verrucomicrobia bacterium]|nr:MbtH family NRPS accessory protein [Verrucomicrobiota bacterium]